VQHVQVAHGGQTCARATCAPSARRRLQGEAFAAQEAQLTDDKRRLRQHVREQELSGEELLKQFRCEKEGKGLQVGLCCRPSDS
jgi:hypothetical protein